MCRYICLSVLILALLGGCNSGTTEAEKERQALTRKIELIEAEGGYVLMVGGETLTSDEIIDSRTGLNGLYVSPKEYFKPVAQAGDFEHFKQRVKRQLEEIIMSKITNILFYQHAKRQAGSNVDEGLEKAAQNEYRRFVLGFGGNQARAEDELRLRQMDKKSFIEEQKRALLIKWYITSKIAYDRPVTYREMEDCYDRIKNKYFARAAKIRFRLIDIQPAKLEVSDRNEDREQLAKRWANKLLALIESGEDFGELAKRYSYGSWREFGGLWRPVEPSSLAAPYDVLAAEAGRMEPGDVTGPIVTKQHVFIMKLEEKQIAGYEPFEDAQELVKEKILLDRRGEVVDKLNADIRREAKLSNTDKFVDFCLEKIYRISNNGGETSGAETRSPTTTTKE
jgi:parvulin-like peptidyl-prolyl isomerase